MATIFPLSASVGQVFDSYTFDGESWNLIGNQFNPTSFSPTEPTNPKAGDLWVDSDSEVDILNDTNLVSTSDLNSYLTIQSASTTYATKTELNNIDLSSASAAAVAAIVDSAPATLDTLNELAASLNDDANFASTITTALGTKLNTSTASATYLTQTSAASTYAPIVPAVQTGFRNAIINGDFRINQRGFTSTTTNNAYGFDRWMLETNTGTCTYSAVAFTLGNVIPGYEPINHARLVTSGQSIPSAYSIFEQRIEDVRSFAGQTVTMSFWAKAGSGTPKISVDLGQNFGTGGSPSTTVNSYAGQVTLSTSWSRYSITFAVPSIAGKTIGTNANTSSLNIFLWVSAGTDFNARTNSLGIQSNTFDFWGVQLEPGTIATPFEQRPIGTELALCQRYFYSIPGGELSVYNPYFNVGLAGGGQYIPTPHPVRMRVAPSLPAITPYTYLQNAAGTALGFQMTLGSTATGFTGGYSSSNNFGSVLPSGYTIGYNQSTINLSAEL